MPYNHFYISSFDKDKYKIFVSRCLLQVADSNHIIFIYPAQNYKVPSSSVELFWNTYKTNQMEKNSPFSQIK